MKTRGFSLGSALPLVSRDAERAARQIVAVMRRRETERVLSLPAKVRARVHGVVPRVTVRVMAELKAKAVDLYLHQQGLDTGTPAGKALFQMLGVFAEFERAMIVERVKAGLRRAEAQGKGLGRPRIAGNVERAIRAELAKGRGILAVAEGLGVRTGTVQRIKAEAVSSVV